MSRIITQRAAREWRRKALAFEVAEDARRSRWVNDYPGGAFIGSTAPLSSVVASVATARLLKHAVVAVNTNGELHFYALPLAKRNWED